MANQQSYSASDIEVLEGLEPVRLRPGMYIGGIDSTAMHHLVNEVLDNSMDEAVAGHADSIKVTFQQGNTITIEDNGRGIPIDPHPKFKDKSALEVIFTTLHSGGKFSGKAYNTSGGLHGVGISVVNALSTNLKVEVSRDKKIYEQTFSQGKPTSKLEQKGEGRRKNGTTVTFTPDTEIFGDTQFNATNLHDLVRSKAYLYKGVTIHWKDETPEEVVKESFHYENGLADYLKDRIGEAPCFTNEIFAGEAKLFEKNGKEDGRVEWALAWPFSQDGKFKSYVNTIPTPQGGTHETGLRAAVLKSVKQYAEMRNKKADSVTADDLLADAEIVLSTFIHEPQFQGQTKDKLSNSGVARMVENAMKDPLDLWLAADTASADTLLNNAIEKAEDRLRRRKEQEVKRKTAVSRRLRLPGKLSDCSDKAASDTEIFIVEGDSAGGSAKQARDRKTQAILPLRGKILNVASATKDKLKQNKELSDLVQALGCGMGKDFEADHLRYERVIIMTDADVDGAHIATLLMTFFYQEMPHLLLNGNVYLALPPLYKMSYGGTSVFAQDDEEKEHHLNTTFKGKKNVEMSRFKGLGEMLPAQLKVTTMSKEHRKLMQISVDSIAETDQIVQQLMGKNPEERLNFIRENTTGSEKIDI